MGPLDLKLTSKNNKMIRTVTDQDLLQTRSKPKGRKTKNKNKGRRIPTRYEESSVLQYPVPHRLWTVLRCRTVNGLIDAVLSISSKVYRPTSYFDIDPDVGGPSYAGYTFYASAYGRYRVLKYDYVVEWSNLQSDGVSVGVYPIADTATPSELATSANPELASENSMGKTMLLGPVGSVSTGTIRGSILASKVWGTPEVETEASWAALTGGSPAANTWLMLTAERINGSALSTGAQFVLTVTAHGYWDQRVNLTS